MSGVRHGRRGEGIRTGHQLLLLGGLVLFWLLLWGSFTPMDVLAGIGVALLATRIFELPPVQLTGRLHPGWLLAYLVRFAGEVVAGSVQVAAYALDPRRQPGTAIVEVKLVTRSDLIITLVAVTLSLVPGSLVIEVDRARSTLFLHALGVSDAAAVDRVRQRSLDTERRLLRAIGSHSEYRKVSR
ncbi:Na+/H+ antiporter subunit E [Naasia sp. SYSU D00057]|uniref:Na+/H+ antiporter subunit E n=1 Tax=Naasia sp. SYSU D00057 TaxID=2817380 RepID=UPI001B317B7C|nr:Na+/H+ antiporter subunit E [Naasia sp. SYSU D00057]